MGRIPYFNCCNGQNKQIIKKTELVVQGFEKYSNINRKETNNNKYLYVNEKAGIDMSTKTLSPENHFINPLPEIVSIKYKKI